MNPLPAAAILVCIAAPSRADVEIRFDEGAPKDRFTILNTGACPLGAARLVVNLRDTAGELIFDVTGAGAGVDVFQPFEVVEGRGLLSALPVVTDGDRAIALPLRGLAPGERIAFTIDVDDTTSSYGIMVSESEIAGGEVRIEAGDGTASGAFDAGSVARVPLASCVS